MLAEFEDKANKRRVVTEGPWSFDRNLVLLKDFDGTQQAWEISIIEALFWVKVHDLPMMACNEYIGGLIDNSIRCLEQVDVEIGEVVWGEYMHIRVSLDVTKPLMWKNKFTIGNLPPVWIPFFP